MTRLFDIIFSFLGLIVLSPIFIILSVWVKLSSKGPVLYRQKRVGKGGDEFWLYKFRSMYVDADKRGLLTVGKDARITSAGHYLRKYKLDELPQLFNVLMGDMSIVGPRPEVKKYVDLYTEEQKKILNVRPGITDLASIKFKNENDLLHTQSDPEQFYILHIMPEKIRFNNIFIKSPTPANYFKIIFMTIGHIFRKSDH
ncbi:MAG: sugar transferase [Flavipsychrobacter sp.]